MYRSFDQPGRSPVYAANAMAATSHPLATTTALTVLREGGNAVDAAIAASATLCVVEPHMTGVGGDCFAFVGEPSGAIHALNASGRAAAGAHLDWYLENGIGEIDDTSPHAVTVPGALRGWEKLHRKFGGMDWARLFADAVDYAEGGFPVAPRVAHDWKNLTAKLAGDTGAARHLLFDGEAPSVGRKICLPALGQTLSRIAKEGADAFYQGKIAAEIAETVRALGGFLGEEDFETGALDASSRDFLESAIKDYNATFGTSFDTSADKFQNYYKDLSLRLKNRELDIVIVVNMFLTGFDATTLNTLWVDKNLRSHGLIQAYSRTNRILNSVKTYGTIVSFRDLEDATNDALALFGNKDARGVVILKPYGDYYGEYERQVAALLQLFPLKDAPFVGEANQKAFTALFGAILRLRNILTSFDEFAGQELLSPRDFQNYQSVYLDLYADGAQLNLPSSAH